MSITMLLFSGPVEAMKPAMEAAAVAQHTPQTKTRRQTDELRTRTSIEPVERLLIEA